MRNGARQQAAIEILTSLETQRQPAADAVKAWMLTHRFAGSKDRAEIGDLVFGALRWKQSSAWRMGADPLRLAPRYWRCAEVFVLIALRRLPLAFSAQPAVRFAAAGKAQHHD